MKSKLNSMWLGKATACAAAGALAAAGWAADTVVSYDTVQIQGPEVDISAMSDDGLVVVGDFGRDVGGGFVWSGDDLKHLHGLSGEVSPRVSADGSTVIGTMINASGQPEAFRLVNGVTTGLGFLPGATSSEAHAVSADGSVVVGKSGNLTFRWENGIMTTLSDQLGGGLYRGSRLVISADGSVVAGTAADGSEAFRWENGVTTRLGILPGYPRSSATHLSADGTTLVVLHEGAAGGPFIRWRDGVTDTIARRSGWTLFSPGVSAISGDGSVAVGREGFNAFRWVDGVMEYLPPSRQSSGGQGAVQPRHVSLDGGIVSGHHRLSHDGVISTKGVYWSAENDWALVYLNDLLDEAGVDRQGYQLAVAMVTGDGSTIVGYATNGSSLRLYRLRIVHTPEAVEIADPNLEAAVRLTLEKPEGSITAEDMASLTELSAPRTGIADLTGLEAATNLVALDLTGNEITSVGPLIGLTKLTRLDIADNRIDLTPGCFSRTLIDQYLPFATCEPQRPQPERAAEMFLANLSTRGMVGSGDAVLIDGFSITGTAPIHVLIRGIGPSLAQFGVTGVLPSPMIQVHRIVDGAPAELVADRDDSGGLVTAAAAGHCGAFPLETDAGDAAVCMELPPGLYTVTLSDANGAEGIGMIEVYQVR